MTVFFSDIRGYTSLSEGMTPQENFRFVNAYNRRMGPIIHQHQGFVNQYLGDGIMAIFAYDPNSALHAAIAMQEEVRRYSAQRTAHRRRPIRVGMGLHSGPLIMGITGDERRLEAVTISDTVNAAARLERLTTHYGASILLSEATLGRLSHPENFHLRYLGRVQVKGKSEPLGIYECLDGDPPEVRDLKLRLQADFAQGLDYFFAREFSLAAVAFERVRKENPADIPAGFFLTRTAQFLVTGVAEDWTGVEVMQEK